MTNSTFISGVLSLMTGTIFVQLITVLISPVITRLYGPEAFGISALFISLTSIMGVIACMRYEQAIVIAENDQEAINILGLCVLSTIFFTILSLPILILIQEPLSHFLKTQEYESLFWLISPLILIVGLYNSFNFWNIRIKKFSRLSIVRVLSGCSTSGTQLLYGTIGIATGGALIGSYILGQILSTLILGGLSIRDNYLFIKRNITFQKIIYVFKRYIKFFRYDMFSALLNTISWQIPIFLLSYFFSSTIVGYYSLGMMMIQLPINLIGNSIAQVFYQRGVDALKLGELNLIVENLFEFLIIIGLYPILILTFIGQDFFTVFFGENWAEAGFFAQIMSIWGLIYFISVPLSMVYLILEKQQFALQYNITNFLTRFSSIIIGGLFGNPLLSLGLFSLSGMIIYGYLCYKMLFFSQVKICIIFRIFWTNLLKFSPAMIIIIYMELLKLTSIIIVIIGFFLCIFYYLYVFSSNKHIREIFLELPIIKRYFD